MATDQTLVKKLLETEKAFKVLYNQVKEIDPKWAQFMIFNPMAMAYRTGNIYKKSEGVLNRWEERFLVLTHCGLLYFKKGDIQPKKFKPLNTFVVEDPSAAE